ncbi:MAG: hypothetical protein M3413_03395 [Bacteroidota bacterium]|jgi:preprotein translocase subunit SecF|nr:hypothetical protein [Bacteroidota bacterium]
MNKILKWGLLGVVLAVISIFLYVAIDSEWTRANNASFFVTVAFFLTASFAILCGMNAADTTPSVNKE